MTFSPPLSDFFLLHSQSARVICTKNMMYDLFFFLPFLLFFLLLFFMNSSQKKNTDNLTFFFPEMAADKDPVGIVVILKLLTLCFFEKNWIFPSGWCQRSMIRFICARRTSFHTQHVYRCSCLFLLQKQRDFLMFADFFFLFFFKVFYYLYRFLVTDEKKRKKGWSVPMWSITMWI